MSLRSKQWTRSLFTACRSDIYFLFLPPIQNIPPHSYGVLVVQLTGWNKHHDSDVGIATNFRNKSIGVFYTRLTPILFRSFATRRVILQIISESTNPSYGLPYMERDSRVP